MSTISPAHPNVLNAAMKQSALYAARASRPNFVISASNYFADFANYLAVAENLDELSLRQGSLEAAVEACGLALERGRSLDTSGSHVLQEAQSLFGMATSFSAASKRSRIDASMLGSPDVGAERSPRPA
jgi:hypothetical protein